MMQGKDPQPEAHAEPRFKEISATVMPVKWKAQSSNELGTCASTAGPLKILYMSVDQSLIVLSLGIDFMTLHQGQQAPLQDGQTPKQIRHSRNLLSKESTQQQSPCSITTIPMTLSTLELSSPETCRWNEQFPMDRPHLQLQPNTCNVCVL